MQSLEQQMTNLEMLKDAYTLAAQSPDPSTQIGAFLVSYNNQHEWLTRTYNRPVAGWRMTEADWKRPRKYDLMVHAERSCLYRAGKYNICTAGATLVATWAACAACAAAIVESGVTRLIRHYPPQDEAASRWLESVSIGDEILHKARVEIIDVAEPIPGAPRILRGGDWFDPTCS